MKKQNRQRRRIIFNDDSHELALDNADTPEGFLAHRIAPLAGTQVDTISWSVLCGQFDAPSYDSRVQPIYGDAHGGRLSKWPKVTENIKALARDGYCPLRLVADFAHEHGMEAFASVRMNDVHDSFMDPHGMTIWKTTHPELMVDTTGMLPEFELYTTAQDFSHETVRRRKLDIIEEIAQGYEIDGFELDYIRHPVLFSRRMRGDPCSAEEIRIITELMGQIRSIAEAASERRDSPVLIAARVPDTFQLALECGMDIQAWLEKDLVDILIIGGGYIPFSIPVRQLVETARPHGVSVYPCVNTGPVNDLSGDEFLKCSRALAAIWHREGAGGIYTWNLGTPFDFKTGEELEQSRRLYYTCLNEIGDFETLAGKDKLYCVDNGSSDVMPYYSHVSSRKPLPLSSKRLAIRKGVIGRVPIEVGDDLEAFPPQRMTLRVTLNDPAWIDTLLLRMNGEELEEGRFALTADGRYCLSFKTDVPTVTTGRNIIEISAHHNSRSLVEGSAVEMSRIDLEVAYDG